MVAEEAASPKQSSDIGMNQEVIESNEKIKINLEIVETIFEIREENNLGKLKRTTKDICPECREKNLQIRVRALESIEEGEDYLKDVDYLYCPGCGYEGEVEPKRVRRKAKGLREKEDDFDGSSDKRRKSTPYRDAKDLRRSNKKSFR